MSASLSEQALVHRSARGANNERLEFLGDAVVGLVVAELLYDRFPKVDEGVLTRMRAHLVCERGLAEVARTLKLGERLQLGPGELKSGGYRRDSILADALEALAAARYFESGWDACRAEVRSWFEHALGSLHTDDFGKDAKTRLQEWMQARALGLPEYELVDATGPEHAREFLVHCRAAAHSRQTEARGNSRKLAEARAAEAMITQLQADERKANPA
ncbi:MAG: ribonuclease III [Rhodanobacteraceae bacterium]|nr:ribonuclease III [Rhodanobacteraceae bacterium]